MKHVVGIDIGATNIRAELADENLNIISSHSEKTDGANLLGQICNIIGRFSGFDAIGVASAGVLDMKAGAIRESANMGIKNLELVRPLEGRFCKPVSLFNDCSAAVIGEKMFGAGKSVENLAYVTISSGIGCGVIVDGRVLLGKDGNAHEVGHCVVDTHHKMRCGCGRYGHWEAYSSGRNMPGFAKLLLETKHRGRASELNRHSGRLTSELLFETAKTDKVASEILDEIGRINAIGIANMINSYDPEIVTLGGAVAINNESAVMRPMKKYLKDYVVNRIPDMRITPLGENVVLCGAVAGALERLRN